jgi:hypothetical protein
MSVIGTVPDKRFRRIHHGGILGNSGHSIGLDLSIQVHTHPYGSYKDVLKWSWHTTYPEHASQNMCLVVLGGSESPMSSDTAPTEARLSRTH